MDRYITTYPVQDEYETLNKKIIKIKILLCFGNPLQKSDY